mmetsp:Transcript_21370/g.84997  ORF Transcript_21370/g.84997 Transcript_21370/m.84997 type:complete len:203 (-) Transcript_21370:323-931(-)
MSGLLPPPRLVRSTATVPGAEVLAPPRAADDAEASRLASHVLAAYANLPFKGRPLVLPGDVVVCEDLWKADLEDALGDARANGLAAVQAFSLEAWLQAKVESDGTAAQREELRALVATLPAEDGGRPSYSPEIIDDGFYSNGLPADIMAVMHQPLVEIPVYRGLGDLPLERASESDLGAAADAPKEEPAPPPEEEKNEEERE